MGREAGPAHAAADTHPFLASHALTRNHTSTEPLGAEKQANLGQTAQGFAETLKAELKKGLDEISKQQPPR
jgi:hypothetical protein